MTLEDCRDLHPVTDNVHGYRLLEDVVQVLGGIIIPLLVFTASMHQCLWENK